MHEFDPMSEGRLKDLADRMPVTGNSASYLLPYYEMHFMQDATGKSILDVCSGGSDLTAALLSLGADAYAVDLGYIDKEGHSKRLTERGRSVNLNYLSSIEENPERYIGASATDLPFPDESFDEVLSNYGIFGVLDEEYDLLGRALDEAIRVLKKGGRLQIGPVIDKKDQIPEKAKANQLKAIDVLKKRDDLIVLDGFTLYPVEPSEHYFQFRKLVIKKKTASLVNPV